MAARSARGLPGLLRRALLQQQPGGAAAEGTELGFAAAQRRCASSGPSAPAGAPLVNNNLNYAESSGKFSPGIFSKKKPLDRSYQWVQKNPFIEAWYYRRDHLEREFVWNFRNTVEAIYLLGGFTFGFYYLSMFCFRQADRRSGYPKRMALGDEPAMILPDEREFY